MHAELLHAVALLSPVVRELRRLVLELWARHGQIDHRREWIAFLIDKLVRDRLQLRVAVNCGAPSHYIASSRIDDRVAHHAQHLVERHLGGLHTFIALQRGLGLGKPFDHSGVVGLALYSTTGLCASRLKRHSSILLLI